MKLVVIILKSFERGQKRKEKRMLAQNFTTKHEGIATNAGYAYRSFCGGCRRRSQSKNKVIATANIAVSVLLGEGRETEIE